jgi:hypothetical protein
MHDENSHHAFLILVSMFNKKGEFFLRNEKFSKQIPGMNPGYEIIEFEVDGVVINRITVMETDVETRIKEFYERAGLSGVAYLIRGSRMNFISLLKNLIENG